MSSAINTCIVFHTKKVTHLRIPFPLGFRVLGLRVLGLRVLGFRVLGFMVLGFKVLGF
jgi:hypothetical protein